MCVYFIFIWPILRQKSVKNLGGFGGNGVSRKNAFEIYWPLINTDQVDNSEIYQLWIGYSLINMRQLQILFN